MRRLLLVSTLALIVSASACGGDDESVEPTSTTYVSSTGTTDTTTSTSTTGTTVAPALIDTDLTDVAWVVFRDGGLFDDQGRQLTELPPLGYEPVVTRSDDGALLFATTDGVYRWEIGQAQPEPVTDAEVELEAPTEITAANGVTVGVVDADVTLDSNGVVDQVLQPAQLEVFTPDGDLEWTTDIGGIAAYRVSLIDFDGRSVLLARAPEEPANPPLQHIVYDLECPTGEDCTRSVIAPYGMVALVGPDSEEPSLNVQLLDLCPTGYAEFITPADTPTPFVQAYQRAGAMLRTCDAYALRLNDEDLDQDWLWTELARALQGPHGPVDGAEDRYRWSPHPDRASVTMTDVGTYVSIDFEIPRQRLPGQVAVTVSPSTVAVSGRADEITADAVRAAAQSVADGGDREFYDLLTVEGPDREADQVADFVAAIDDTLSGAAVGEVQLTDDGLEAWSDDTAEADAADDAVAFAFGDFAAGGEGSFDDLPVADEVLLALGSQVYARRSATGLADRGAWSINAPFYADLAGPFNLLIQTPAPARFAIGPHDRCASPVPLPAPPELARYRRISIEPAEGTIESCIDWWSIELFVDDGRIVGVAADAVGP
jgi:hypothetical protein